MWVSVFLIKTNGQCGTLITMPITGRVRILPGWGVGQRSMSLQAVGRSNIQQLLFANEAQLAPSGQSDRQSRVQTSNYTVVLIYGCGVKLSFWLFQNTQLIMWVWGAHEYMWGGGLCQTQDVTSNNIYKKVTGSELLLTARILISITSQWEQSLSYGGKSQLTSLQTRLLFLKVFWSHDLQQGVEKGHIGQLTDQDQRLWGTKKISIHICKLGLL